MKIQLFAFLVICVILGSCSEKTETNSNSNEWELVIEDSIQVEYLSEIEEGIFANGFGVIKNQKNNTFVKFDSTGQILIEKKHPTEGPNSVQFVESIHFQDDFYYGTTSLNDIYRFSDNLELYEKIEMPFPGEARGGPYNRRNLKIWNNKILLWYPGRDGISPYKEFFFRDHFLLELYDLETKTSTPLIRTPPTSKFSSNDFFIHPSIQFTIESDSLYLTFSNEEQIHIYTLPDGKWIKSVEFSPKDFKLLPAQKSAVTGPQRSSMREARISGIYSDKNNLFLTYSGGIDSETFKQHQLGLPENYPLITNFNKNYLKLYSIEKGTWSNEIQIPSKIDFFLNIESTDKPFYALRNDDFIGEEQEYLTFYKLRLVQK